MKKLFLVTISLFALTYSSNAQEVRFGATAGYLNARGVLKYGEATLSNSESGFYAGAVADFNVSESFSIQPELLYARVDGSDGLMLPILGKIAVAEKLNFQVGPQIVFSLEETVGDFSKVELDIAGGIGYDIDEDFFLEARYTFQINNSYTGSEDIKVRGNYLTIGVGYKFL